MNTFTVDIFQKMLQDPKRFHSEKQARQTSLFESLKRILASIKTTEDFIGNEGIPDFYTLSFQSAFNQNIFCTAVREAILLQEPRLKAVHVETLHNENAAEIILKIEAFPHHSSTQEMIAFYFLPLEKTVQYMNKL